MILPLRFSHIIRGQFFGHCHKDDIRIQYDVREPDRAIGVQYLTPNKYLFSHTQTITQTLAYMIFIFGIINFK